MGFLTVKPHTFAMPQLSDFTLYHRAVRDMRGDELLPLNRLRDVHPDIYEREAEKYAGREQLRREKVLALDCQWGDVLFFSPVHPAQLLDTVREGGREVPPVRFWALNAAKLEPQRACIKFVRPWPGGAYTPPTPADYLSYTPEHLAQVCQPSEMTLTRLQALPPDSPLILWMDVPHVLYRGTVPREALTDVLA